MSMVLQNDATDVPAYFPVTKLRDLLLFFENMIKCITAFIAGNTATEAINKEIKEGGSTNGEGS